MIGGVVLLFFGPFITTAILQLIIHYWSIGCDGTQSRYDRKMAGDGQKLSENTLNAKTTNL